MSSQRNYRKFFIVRVFNNFFPSTIAFGAATVADLLFFHEPELEVLLGNI